MSGIAKTRHQLATLLRDAYQNREALEERIAEGRRNRKEAGNKYGKRIYLRDEAQTDMISRFLSFHGAWVSLFSSRINYALCHLVGFLYRTNHTNDSVLVYAPQLGCGIIKPHPM